MPCFPLTLFFKDFHFFFPDRIYFNPSAFIKKKKNSVKEYKLT